MPPENLNEIFEDLKVDCNSLDFECIDQPRRFMKWSEKFARAIKDRDTAKKAASLLRSDTSMDIRSRPEAYHLEKVTEGGVQATLESLDTVKEADDEVIEANYIMNVMAGAKDAFEQRRSMLESLIKLYISGYFSQVRPDSRFIQSEADRGTAAQRELLNKLGKRKSD